MGTPLQTQILDLVKSRLDNITEINGYSSTVEKIERAKLEPFMNQEMPAINYYYVTDEFEKQIYAGVSDRIVVVVIEYYDTTRDKVFSDLSSSLSSDVEIALFRDTLAPLVTDGVSDRLGGKVRKLDIESIVPAIVYWIWKKWKDFRKDEI